mgnify:CR=1 FL=1
MRKFIVIVTALVVLYAAAGFLLAPFLVRHFGEKALREQTGPEAAIESVRINPFTLTATVEGLRVPDAGSGFSARVERVFVNFAARSLWAWHPVFQEVRVEGPQLALERRTGAEAPRATAESAGPGWRETLAQLDAAGLPELTVERLRVAGGGFTFRDRTVAPDFVQTVRPLRFTLEAFTTVAAEEAGNTFAFTAKTPGGARFRLEGGLDVSALGAEGRVELSGVAVERFSPYYAEASPVVLERAVFDLSFAYAVNAAEPERLFRISEGGLALRDVVCRTANPDAPLMSLDAAKVEGVRYTFPEMRLDVGAVTLRGGATHVRRAADGVLNLTALAPPGARPDAEAPGKQAGGGGTGAGIRYAVDSVRLLEHRIVWRDAAVTPEVALAADVEALEVEGIASDAAEKAALSGRARIGQATAEGGGELRLEGGFAPDGSEADVGVELEGLPLALAAPYGKAYGNFAVNSGTLTFDGRVKLAPDTPLRLTGSGAVAGFASGLAEGAELAAEWERLAVEQVALAMAPFSLGIESVRLEAPTVRYTRAGDGGAAATRDPEVVDPGADAGGESGRSGDPEPDEAGSAAGGESGEAGGTAPVRVGTFALTGGRVVFTDEAVSPASTLEASDIALTVSSIAPGSGGASELSLSGNVAGSPLEAEGAVSLEAPGRDTRLDVSLGAFPLPRLSPYAEPVLGRRIANGALSLDGEWRLAERRLEASNRIRIKRLRFGDKVAGGSGGNLPLGLAVTLLTGPDDTIAVSLPLSGDLGGPRAEIGSIVRTALFGLVRETVSAPFNLLSGLVKTEKDLSRIAFATDKARLDTEATERLNTLADALKQRPEVRLRLEPVLSEADVASLARVELTANLLRRAPDPATAEVDDLLLKAYARETDASEEALAELDPSVPEDRRKIVEALLPGVTVPESEKAALARERMGAVRTHLTQARGIDPERIREGDFATDAEFAGVRFALF